MKEYLHKIMCYFGYHEPWSHRETLEWLLGGKICCSRCLRTKPL